MSRVQLLVGTLLALFWPQNAPGQLRSGAPQIGVLCPTTCSGRAMDAFRRGLAEQGLRDGETVTLM